MAPTRFWADMTWRDFRARRHERGHRGPAGRRDRAARAAPAARRRCHHQRRLRPARRGRPCRTTCRSCSCRFRRSASRASTPDYPGTLTLSVETAIRAWTEIGDSVARTGCRKLVVMNSHGGNGAAIEAVTLHLRMRWRMLAVHASWRRLGYPDGLFSSREAAHGVHGGDAETSLMLALRPDLVRACRGPRLPERGRSDRARLRAPARQAAARLRLGGERPQSRGRGRGGRQGDGGKGRGGDRLRRRAVHRAAARRPGFRPRATRATGRWRPRRERAALRFRARGASARAAAGSRASTRSGAARSPGPVGVAAVILDPDDLPEGLDDSKALPEAKRDALRPVIFAKAISVSVAFASAEEIDRFNIRGATLRAMARAVARPARRGRTSC